LPIAKLIFTVVCALALMVHNQNRALAADSGQCYEIVQTHTNLGRVTIYFNAKSMKMDLFGGRLLVFADSPDWAPNVFNPKTKKQSSKSIADWCKTNLELYTPWIEVKNLNGKYQKPIPTFYDGFKAVKLICADTKELETDEHTHGIDTSITSSKMPFTVRYAFLDGIKMDDHIPKIVSALYSINWKDKLPLAYFGRYQGSHKFHWLLNTNSIKMIPSDSARFKRPTGFQYVSMTKVTASREDYLENAEY
jgi:hypothetical protein